MKWTDLMTLEDSTVRKLLQAEYGDIIQEGLSSLDKCLAIDQEHEDAMLYLVLREWRRR